MEVTKIYNLNGSGSWCDDFRKELPHPTIISSKRICRIRVVVSPILLGLAGVVAVTGKVELRVCGITSL